MRSRRTLGGALDDVGGFLSNVVGGFATAEQAQGAISQAQRDAMYAQQQQQTQSMMMLLVLGVGAFLLLRHPGTHKSSSTSSPVTKGTRRYGT